MAKINITVNDELLSKIDNFADENYMSRSGVFAQGAQMYLAQMGTYAAIKQIAFDIHKIADMGTVDDETRRDLDDMQRLVQMMIPTK